MKIIFIILAILLIGCQTLTVLQFDITYEDSTGQHSLSFRSYSFSNGVLKGLGVDYKEYEIRDVKILSIQKYFIGVV